MEEKDPEYQVFESPVSDLSKVARYTRTWEQGLTQDVYGYQVKLPDMPPVEDIVNFGLSIDEQVFRKTEIPSDLRGWPLNKKEEFIEREYHRRKEGLWYFIKGEPVYIPGTMYFFMNYWWLQTGRQPIFRMSDLDFFLIWMHVVRSPKIFGLIVFKCRRIGDTEKALCMIYEYASRVKNTYNAMQDGRTVDDILETYRRLIFAHQKMVWFMKPINRGSTNPKAALEFKIPEKKTTSKSYVAESGNLVLDETEFEYDAVGSTVTYYPSKPESGDGKRHGRYYFDEFGKKKMLSAIDAWRFVKKSMVDDIYKVLAGKALFTSTIEDMREGDSLKISKKLWKDSDPEKLTPSGQTKNGMIRVVRGTLEKGNLDRWGYVDKEARRKEIEEERRALIADKDWSGLITHQRQECIDEKDVFTNVSDGANFNIENLTAREFTIEFEMKQKPYVMGNFEWKDNKPPVLGNPNGVNKRCAVVFEPNTNGRFCVSRHPKDYGLTENRFGYMSEKPVPYNIHAFCCGIDPVAQKDVVDKEEQSLSGLCIKRKYDPLLDSGKFDEKNKPLNGGLDFISNRYVCTYLYRHEDPADNYDDWLKALVYYGSDFLIEKNHGAGFQQYLEARGFEGFYMDQKKGLKNYKGQTEEGGITASEKTVDYYFSLLTTISNQWYNTIDHPQLLDQLKSMTMENKGKKDLGVAAGICEVAAQTEIQAPESEEESAEDMHFEEYIY